MDLCFSGLVKKFGVDHVIDIPANDKHRQGLPVLVGDDEKDYGVERRSLCYVSGCESMRHWTVSDIRREYVMGNIVYIFMDETDWSFEQYLKVFGPLAKMIRRKDIIVIAGHDSYRGNPMLTDERFDSSLKAQFIDDWNSMYDVIMAAGDTIAPLYVTNLSCNFDHLWSNQRRYAHPKNDICFIGYNSNPIRKVVIDHVRSNWSHLDNAIVLEERHDMFNKFIRHSQMFDMMANSKICLNLPGASTGGRALRFYEIPFVGSYMLTKRFDAVVLDPPRHRVHCSYFDTLDELDEEIDWALKNPMERREIAERGASHFAAHHTDVARIDYIFGKLDG